MQTPSLPGLHRVHGNRKDGVKKYGRPSGIRTAALYTW